MAKSLLPSTRKDGGKKSLSNLILSLMFKSINLRTAIMARFSLPRHCSPNVNLRLTSPASRYADYLCMGAIVRDLYPNHRSVSRPPRTISNTQLKKSNFHQHPDMNPGKQKNGQYSPRKNPRVNSLVLPAKPETSTHSTTVSASCSYRINTRTISA